MKSCKPLNWPGTPASEVSRPSGPAMILFRPTRSGILLFLTLAILVVAMPCHAQTPVFNCSGFASTGTCAVHQAEGGTTQPFLIWGSYNGANPGLSGSEVMLIQDGVSHQAANLNYQTAVNVQAFTSTFSFIPFGQCVAFTLNNNTNSSAGGVPGSHFNAGASGECSFYQGDGGVTSSVNNVFALEFDQYSFLNQNDSSFTYSSAQIYQAQAYPYTPYTQNAGQISGWATDKISTSPVPLNSPANSQGSTSTDTFSATITYTGYNVTLQLYDATAGGSCPGSSCFTHTWDNIDIPSWVDGTTAYVGLSSSNGLSFPHSLYIAGFSYTVLPPASTPTCTDNSGTISCSTSSPDATICTSMVAPPHTDGIGGCPDGTIYAGPFTPADGGTLYAIAGSGTSQYGDSLPSTLTFAVGSATPEPTLLLDTDQYYGAQMALVNCPSSATCYYTTDGSTPTTSSSQYTGGVPVNSTETLKVIANSGGASSSIASAIYTINPFSADGATAPANAPVASPAPGTYAGTQNVTLTTSTSGAYICYLLSATPPLFLPQTNNDGGCSVGTLYTGPVTVTSSQTLYAIAGTTLSRPPSSVAQETYIITGSGTPDPPTNVHGNVVAQ